MSLRALLVGLIALATAGFVVGTAIERNSGETHHDAKSSATSVSSERKAHAGGGEGKGAHSESGEEGSAAHVEKGTHKERSSETHGEELKPLGIDIEAAPFVALAAVVSLLLALAAWFRPRWVLLLAVVVTAMVAFAALDVREVFHQSDESRTGLAVLAAVIAALHVSAAGVAGLMGRHAARPVA
ncbi:MAG: hypothetical protein ABR581_10830 [Thermoleophilaceae bacterium]